MKFGLNAVDANEVPGHTSFMYCRVGFIILWLEDLKEVVPTNLVALISAQNDVVNYNQ